MRILNVRKGFTNPNTCALLLILGLSISCMAGDTPATQPADASGGFLQPMLRQAVVDALTIPTLEKGQVQGPERPAGLLSFIVKDYNARTDSHSDSPQWTALNYSVIAYEGAVHDEVASGTGSFSKKDWPVATYSMAVLDNAGSVTHALIQAAMTNKNGGLFAAQWDLCWTSKGWFVQGSVTPTAAVVPRVPDPIN